MTFAALFAAACGLYALVAWRDPRRGLFVLAAALPAYLLRAQLGPIPITLLEAFALILVAVWLVKERPALRQIVPEEWGKAIVLVLLAATVAAFVAQDLLSALGIWKAYFVEPILVFLVAADVLKNPKIQDTQNRLLLALGLGGLFVAVGAIAQYATGLGIPAPWDVERRVTGVFPYPNAVGLYLAPIVVIGVVESWSRGVGEWRKNILWIAVFAFGLAAIAFAQSEAAMVAVAATLLIAGLATKRTRKLAALFAAFAMFAVALSPALRDKITFNDYSGQVRRSQWEETIAMLADRPLTGAGLNGYPSTMVSYHEATQYEIFQYPHTLALNVWSELGLLGLVALAAVAFQAAKCLALGARQNRAAALACLALIAMTVHSLADVGYFKNDLSMMTWLLLAVIASSYASSPRRA